VANQTARERERERERERQTDRQTGRQTDRQTDRDTERQTARQADRQTDRHKDTQTERETDRQTETETETETETQTQTDTADRQTERLRQLQVAQPPRRRAAAPRAWSEVWPKLEHYDAPWTDEKVAVLKAFLKEAGLKHLHTHASRIIKENRAPPLHWGKDVDYGKALDSRHGRVKQGGAAAPWVVRKEALKAYLATLR
jgi:hypothetical protein